MTTSPWKLTFQVLGSALLIVAVVAIVASGQFAPMPLPEDGVEIFTDDFERLEIGSDYLQGTPDPGHTAERWRIESFCTPPGEPKASDSKSEKLTFDVHRWFSFTIEGHCSRKLVAENIHNAALWLQKALPEKVRVEFEATALTPTGDVKSEIFGDGITHQSGYILIMGGWSNQLNIIARQDEHGEDRKRDNRCVVRNRRKVCVEKGKVYRWAIERRDKTLKWFVNDKLFMTYPDRYPIQGKHFGFNNWEAKVAFDHLRILKL
ncbi:MAG: hypothetical protein ACPGQS_13455 [Bradymonadia bacterium]